MYLHCSLRTMFVTNNIINKNLVHNDLVKLLLINLILSNYVMTEYTTVNVKIETFENLKRRITYGQTMDGLINWLLDKTPDNYLEPICSECGGLLTSKIGTKLQSCTNCELNFEVKKVRNNDS
jgi:hypothetical protein